jgi:hypothetical protein
MADRGKDTSWALVEVRTVRSRALTAIHSILSNPQRDPDQDDMITELTKVVDGLERWARA